MKIDWAFSNCGCIFIVGLFSKVFPIALRLLSLPFMKEERGGGEDTLKKDFISYLFCFNFSPFKPLMQLISTICSSLPGHQNLEMKEVMKNVNTYMGEGTQEEK